MGWLKAILATMTAELVREFVIAGHGNFEKVKTMLEQNPELLEQRVEWRENDFETALQGASHVGNHQIAEFLLSKGATLEITTAAMLGDSAKVQGFLAQDPKQIQHTGGHGITLLTHAVMSGDVALVRMLIERGATTGADMALNIATDCGFLEVVREVLTLNPDPTWKNFRGQSSLDLAQDKPEILVLLEV
jgi:uncharacterized protein